MESGSYKGQSCQDSRSLSCDYGRSLETTSVQEKYKLTISPLPSRLCLPFVSHVCAHTSGLSLSLPVSPIACDQLTIREDMKCVIPDDRPRDEGEGPPFICVRGGCEQVSSFAKPI